MTISRSLLAKMHNCTNTAIKKRQFPSELRLPNGSSVYDSSDPQVDAWLNKRPRRTRSYHPSQKAPKEKPLPLSERDVALDALLPSPYQYVEEAGEYYDVAVLSRAEVAEWSYYQKTLPAAAALWDLSGSHVALPRAVEDLQWWTYFAGVDAFSNAIGAPGVDHSFREPGPGRVHLNDAFPPDAHSEAMANQNDFWKGLTQVLAGIPAADRNRVAESKCVEFLATIPAPTGMMNLKF